MKRTENVITSAIELYCGLQRNLLFSCGSLAVFFLSVVKAVDIRLVMLGVMQRHYLPRDMRLKSLEFLSIERH